MESMDQLLNLLLVSIKYVTIIIIIFYDFYDYKKKMFLRYLKEIRHVKENEITDKNLKPIRLILPWRTIHNKMDCGVFVMRHMVSYFGETDSKWRYRLPKEGPSQENVLKKLRMQYATTILISEIKSNCDILLKVAYKYQKLDAKTHGKHSYNSQFNLEGSLRSFM